MFGPTAVALVTAIYLGFAAIVVTRMVRQRSAERGLRWPAGMTQRRMETCGARFMARLGWRVMLASSHGSHSLYACTKQDEYLYTLFLRDSSMFLRQLRSLGVENTQTLRRLVIVLFDPPTEAMHRNAADAQLSIMHYRDLPMIEERHAWLLPAVMAARVTARVTARATATSRGS